MQDVTWSLVDTDFKPLSREESWNYLANAWQHRWEVERAERLQDGERYQALMLEDRKEVAAGLCARFRACKQRLEARSEQAEAALAAVLKLVSESAPPAVAAAAARVSTGALAAAPDQTADAPDATLPAVLRLQAALRAMNARHGLNVCQQDHLRAAVRLQAALRGARCRQQLSSAVNSREVRRGSPHPVPADACSPACRSAAGGGSLNEETEQPTAETAEEAAEALHGAGVAALVLAAVVRFEPPLRGCVRVALFPGAEFRVGDTGCCERLGIMCDPRSRGVREWLRAGRASVTAHGEEGELLGRGEVCVRALGQGPDAVASRGLTIWGSRGEPVAYVDVAVAWAVAAPAAPRLPRDRVPLTPPAERRRAGTVQDWAPPSTGTRDSRGGRSAPLSPLAEDHRTWNTAPMTPPMRRRRRRPCARPPPPSDDAPRRCRSWGCGKSRWRSSSPAACPSTPMEPQGAREEPTADVAEQLSAQQPSGGGVSERATPPEIPVDADTSVPVCPHQLLQPTATPPSSWEQRSSRGSSGRDVPPRSPLVPDDARRGSELRDHISSHDSHGASPGSSLPSLVEARSESASEMREDGSAAAVGCPLLDAPIESAAPVAADGLTQIDLDAFGDLLGRTAGSSLLLSSGTYGEVLAGTFAVKRAAAQQWDSVQVLTDEYHMIEYLHDQGAERVVQILATHLVDDKVNWFVMPRLACSLHDAGKLAERPLLKCARGLLQGLQHLERCEVVHLDLKPGNLMLDAEGEVTLIDFGLAQRTRERAQADCVFTPQWLPLECLLSEAVDVLPSMDWYAAGLVLWQAATGTHPCGAEQSDYGKMLGLLEQAFGEDPGSAAKDIAQTPEPAGPATRFFDRAWGLRARYLARDAPSTTLEAFPVSWICPVVRSMVDFNPAFRIPPAEALSLLEAQAACVQ